MCQVHWKAGESRPCIVECERYSMTCGIMKGVPTGGSGTCRKPERSCQNYSFPPLSESELRGAAYILDCSGTTMRELIYSAVIVF
jgi:hypothetical protein